MNITDIEIEQLKSMGWDIRPERGEGWECESPWPFNRRMGYQDALLAAPIVQRELETRSKAELRNVAWKGHGSLCNKHINRRISRRAGYNSLMECDCWVKAMWEAAKSGN